MNHRDYLKFLKQTDKQIDELMVPVRALQEQRRETVALFKVDCPHPENKLDGESNYYEDEYGCHMSSWTDYNYRCTRCGIEVKCVKKAQDIKSLQQTLKDEAKAQYDKQKARSR